MLENKAGVFVSLKLDGSLREFVLGLFSYYRKYS